MALLGNLSCVFNRSHCNPNMKQKYNAGTAGFMISSNLLTPWFPHLDVTSLPLYSCPDLSSTHCFSQILLQSRATTLWHPTMATEMHERPPLPNAFPIFPCCPILILILVYQEYKSSSLGVKPHFNLLSFDNPEVSSNQIISTHYSHSCLTILCW